MTNADEETDQYKFSQETFEQKIIAFCIQIKAILGKKYIFTYYKYIAIEKKII